MDIIGDGGNNILIGTNDADRIDGLGGNDTLKGFGGDDIMNGGDGNDIINAGSGDDIIDGGQGVNTLTGGGGNDIFVVSSQSAYGNTITDFSAGDRIDLSYFGVSDFASLQFVIGQSGSDTVISLGHYNPITLSGVTAANLTAADFIFAPVTTTPVVRTNDYISFGSDGDDILTGNPSNILIGGNGNDRLTGGGIMYGGAGNDIFDYGSYVSGEAIGDFTSGDVIDVSGMHVGDFASLLPFITSSAPAGTLGTVTIAGLGLTLNNVDVATLDAGDFIFDTSTDPVVASGYPVLYGAGGDDHLSGAGTLVGGAGDDVLSVTSNYYTSTSLYGGTGNDTFAFDPNLRLSTTVMDFTTGDKLDLSALGFTDVSAVLPLATQNGADTVIAIDANSIILHAVDLASLTADSLKLAPVDGPVTGHFGGAGDDVLIVDDSLVLSGGSGDDILSSTSPYGAGKMFGGDGDDRLINGQIMSGGAGNDVFVPGLNSIYYGDSDDFIEPTEYVVDFSHGDKIDLSLFRIADFDVLLGMAKQDGADTLISVTGIYIQYGVYLKNVDMASLTAEDFIFDTSTTPIVARGTYHADHLNGSLGDDTLNGDVGADVMYGGGGNDTYYVDNIGDQVVEQVGKGDDTVITTLSNYVLAANVENLQLSLPVLSGAGNSGDNHLIGNALDNVLDGGGGVDVLTGGLGNDTYLVDNALDTVVENAGEGTDTVVTTVDYTLGQNVEILMAAAGVTGITLSGNTGANTFKGNGSGDIMAGGAGDDIYYVMAGDTVVENAGDGFDTMMASGDAVLILNVESLVLTGVLNLTGTGTAGDDRLTGNSGNNILHGLDGNDILDGGLGKDSLDGGLGDDTYYVNNIGDMVTEASDSGVDTVMTSVTYTLSANVENLTMISKATINGTGNSLDNILTGNAAGNQLYGLDGNDTIDAGAGTDRVTGGAGDDILTGGAGPDTFYYSQGFGNDIITDFTAGEQLDLSGLNISNLAALQPFMHAEGADTVIALTYNGQAETITLKNVDLASLTAASFVFDTSTRALVATGTAGNDILFGGDGNTTFNGGGGEDRMIGGLGDDTYNVDSSGDVVIEQAGQGTDTVVAAISYSLGDNVENLTLVGTLDLKATGNALANTLTGNSGANSLDGGLGADHMAGGAGNDTYYVDNASDVVIELSAGGNDLVVSTFSYSLGANLEALRLAGSGDLDGTGNSLANSLTGNAGANHLSGGSGNDRLDGAGGNDVLTGGLGADTFVFGLGGGQDTVSDFSAGDRIDVSGSDGFTGYIALEQSGADTLVRFSTTDMILLQNVSAASLTQASFVFASGPGPIVGTSAAETLTGTNGDDVINGLGGNDKLYGLDGKDVLYGGTGADTMIGGTGNDTYYVDNAGDVVTELAGSGIDTVFSSRVYTLGADVEKLTLTGSTHIAGTGNALANVLIGNDGNNHLLGLAGNDTLSGGLGNDVLDGGKGADVMKGGAGDDRYYVENTGDVITEYSGQGQDTVITTLNYALGANVEDLIQVGTHNYYASGNALDNRLTGNIGNNLFHGGDGNDVIDGGKGADKMYGGLGNDTFYVDNVGDVVVEYTSQGTDTVISTITYTLGGAVENLTLTGAANINGTGTSGDNILIGNAGSNILNGSKGHDVLTGGLGADTFVFSATSGADTITDFQAGQNDRIDLSAYTHGTAHAGYIHQVGSDTRIDFGGGNVITLTGVTATDSAFLGHIVW